MTDKTPLTFTLHCNPHTTHARSRAEDRTATLNELRAWLLNEAMRYEWNMEGLTDLYEAVENNQAPDATAHDIACIASQVWDEHPNNVYVSPGDPLNDLTEETRRYRQCQMELDQSREILRQRALRASEAGFSAYRIAQIAGVSQTSVAMWLHEARNERGD